MLFLPRYIIFECFYNSDIDPGKGAESSGDEQHQNDNSYDLTSPVASFLERSRIQVERYFRKLTQPELTDNGEIC